MVSDLLLGGDLRYHLSQDVVFSERSVALFAVELGQALDYLRNKLIIHRDIKPVNILLDEKGHAHITDFNIATVLKNGQLATSRCGTKPYIAPEVFGCVLEDCAGYTFAVDWWSLGVTLYELLGGTLPFDINPATTIPQIKSLLLSPVYYPLQWSRDIIYLLNRLLCITPGARISSFKELKQTPILKKFIIDMVLEKQIQPSFSPLREHLNRDPIFELEEMIAEAKSLCKKKKRLAKQRSMKVSASAYAPESGINNLQFDFVPYNREKELKRREMESKENAQKQELTQAMNASSNEPVETRLPENLLAPSTSERRSSCKLAVSPVSVQTRRAAASRNSLEAFSTESIFVPILLPPIKK